MKPCADCGVPARERQDGFARCEMCQTLLEIEQAAEIPLRVRRFPRMIVISTPVSYIDWSAFEAGP